MKIKSSILLLLTFVLCSCVSTKSTLKNVDENAPIPKLTPGNAFVLTEYSDDKKYGYDKDYPINVFYRNTKDDTINQQRFLNALSGPNGEEIKYLKMETCCPFPTKKSEMGVGFLDIYEISWDGQKSPIRLYFNLFEKGSLKIPMGFSLKKN